MNHLKALTIKFVLVTSILLLMLLIFDNASILSVLLISLLVTGVSYLIGDLLILPRTSIMTATGADFILNFAAIALLSFLFIEQPYPLAIVAGFASFFIACGEGFFHRYMVDHVLGLKQEDPDSFLIQRQYQTEFAEEEHIRKKDNEED